jgi:hypothetical protein
MLEIFKKHKKIWLIGVLIIAVLILLFVGIRDYFYLKGEVSQLRIQEAYEEGPQVDMGDLPGIEEAIEKGIEECRMNFDLNKLDFTKPIWDSELPIMLLDLIAIQAFDKNDANECNYFENKGQIHILFSVKECQFVYRLYFDLVEKLKKGISFEDYLNKCQAALNLSSFSIQVDEEKLREPANKMVCESLYLSYQDKSPIIINPVKLCDGGTESDVCDYFDENKELKTCQSGICDEIKFLIAVAKNDSNICLTIDNPKTSQYCQFYFDRDLRVFQNKFAETYCHNFIQKVVAPSIINVR